jgi:predicted transcriptional regulator
MGKNTTMTVRIPPEVNSRLETLARDTRRSKADLAEQAIVSFVERNAWQVAQIKQALDEAKSGTPGIPHEDIERWIESWDTDRELPPPEPKP